jgi:hypothetical protein
MSVATRAPFFEWEKEERRYTRISVKKEERNLEERLIQRQEGGRDIEKLRQA